jgi:hypothetical protein
MDKILVTPELVIAVAHREARHSKLTLAELDATVRGLTVLLTAVLERMPKQELLEIYEQIKGDDLHSTSYDDCYNEQELRVVAHLPDVLK